MKLIDKREVMKTRVRIKGGKLMHDCLLTDKEILAAWEGAFDKPISLDHKPTANDIVLIRIKAVLAAEEKKRPQPEDNEHCPVCHAYHPRIVTEDDYMQYHYGY